MLAVALGFLGPETRIQPVPITERHQELQAFQYRVAAVVAATAQPQPRLLEALLRLVPVAVAVAASKQQSRSMAAERLAERHAILQAVLAARLAAPSTGFPVLIVCAQPRALVVAVGPLTEPL